MKLHRGGAPLCAPYSLIGRWGGAPLCAPYSWNSWIENMWSLGIYTKAFVKDRFFIPHCNLLSAPSFCVLGESPYLSWGFVLPDLTVYCKSRGLNVAFDTCNASPCCLIISLGIYIKTFVKRQFLHPHCNLHSAPGFCVPGESPYLREISGSLF